tara:strand:+ start:52 stop:237 length:186 start_codon:yes stop_codon:yes gene_type:complete
VIKNTLLVNYAIENVIKIVIINLFKKIHSLIENVFNVKQKQLSLKEKKDIIYAVFVENILW